MLQRIFGTAFFKKAALDEDLKEDLLRELKSELQISKPVVFVSHNKEEVNELCDFKYKIKQGEIV